MREHIKADEPFERTDVPVAEALERFRAEGQDYKVELIEDLVETEGVETVSLYRNGPFTDLCRGPHAPGTKRIKAFKLTSVAGAYWRGDADRQMLTRIYGTAFLAKEDLDEHLERLEEARARDHRKLGKRARPVHVQRAVARLAVLAARTGMRDLERARPTSGATENAEPRLPRGAARRSSTTSSSGSSRATGTVPREHVLHRRRGPPDGPQADELPGAHPDLQGRPPLLPRPADPLSEFGPVHRYEPSGTLHGLLRVRDFTQDDAHLFCTEDQVEEEVQRCLDFGFVDLRHVRLRAAARALDPARQARRQRRDVGPRRGARSRRRSTRRGPRLRASTRATAPSTGRRSTST